MELTDKIRRVYLPMTETGFYILFCLQKENHGYGITPVSYTHLDVYKRQNLICWRNRLKRPKGLLKT